MARFLYGYIYEPWHEAPDQIAWEFVLEQFNFRYDNLIHYPHEGGTILISFIGLFVELFTDFSSLTISAFIIDFTIRFFQIKIIKNVFNPQIATIFGFWTIFAAPLLIPWGTITYGLHPVARIFPFIFIYILHQKKETVKHHLICGAFIGLAFWFSYSNMVLIPIFFLYRIINREKINKWIYSVLSLFLILIAHFLVKLYFDAGYQLEEISLTSIRGAVFSIHEIDFLDKLSYIPDVIANCAITLPISNTFTESIRFIYFLLIIISGFGFIKAYRKHLFDKSVYMIIPTILLFLIIYIFSPFFYSSYTGGYVKFRHLTYIAPLIAAYGIAGLSTLRYKFILSGLFLFLGICASSALFMKEKPPERDVFIKAPGWILGKKFGHDQEMLSSIIEDNPQKRELLIQGIAWGISTSLMDETTQKFDEEKATSKVDKLVRVISGFPKTYQNDLLEGIKFSFSDEVTPRLDKNLFIKFKKKMKKNEKESK